MLYIGIDLGTSAVKLAFNWTVKGTSGILYPREYPFVFPTSRLVGTEAGGLV